MNCFIGIDGGGSKTCFALVTELGEVLGRVYTDGTAYRDCGVPGVVKTLKEGIAKLLEGADGACVSGVCFGMPCLGESPANDDAAVKEIERALSPLPVCFYNDVAVGWAGSLAFEPGINIVAGTGSMATGRDESGMLARSGGWSEFFSDEGSCYWLGKRALELFSKQADGRLKRGALYGIIRSEFDLEDDFDLIGKVEGEFASSRKRVASVQKYAAMAALDGDRCAAELYLQAAEELAAMADAVARRLNFEHSPIAVSYSGGLFNTGALILYPLKTALDKRLKVRLIPPRLPPELGAVLFAADKFAPNLLKPLIAALTSS